MNGLLAALLVLAPGPVGGPVAPTTDGAAWSGPKSATATAEKADVRLGEPFTVNIEVHHERGEKWSLQPGEKLDPFKLRSQKELPIADSGVTKIALELSLFQLGSHPLPELTLLAAAPGQPPHEFKLPGPVIKGVDALGKDRERRDIRPPVPFKVTTFKPLLYLLVALTAMALIVWGIIAWRRRPKKEKVDLTPRLPAHDLAFQALTVLENEGLPGRGRVKEFHLRLSEILRRYLGERYGIFALDMTSEELYQTLARLPTEGLSMSDLQWVCGQGDLAKFAKGEPTIDDCKQALSMVRQLVARTRRNEFNPLPGQAIPGVAA